MTRPVGGFLRVVLAGAWWLIRAFVGVMIRLFQMVAWLFGFGWTSRE